MNPIANTKPVLFKKTLGNSDKLQMIWLHGWGQDHRSLTGLANLFKKKGEMVLYDLPGFGHTAMLPKGAGTEAYADCMIDELKKLKPEQRIIVAHSFGCRVAIRIAAKAPELLEAMILIAAAGIPKKQNVFFQLKRISLKTLGKLANITDHLFKTDFQSTYRKRFGSRDYRNAGELRETFVATVNENLTEISKKIKIPILLLYGSEDLETPVEIGKSFALVLKNAELKVLKGFGHLDILDRGQHQCQHNISRFLESHGLNGC